MLNQVSALMIKDEPTSNLHGPWWFLQLWVNLYSSKVAALDLQSFSFPDLYPEGSQPIRRRCTSLGEAVLAIPGQQLNAEDIDKWLRIFYKGIPDENLLWFPYTDMNAFEITFLFRVDTPLSDTVSAKVFVTCVSPCILPINVGMDDRQQISYEFYYPSAAARQLGLGQLPIDLYYAGKVKSRAALHSSLEYHAVLNLTQDLPAGNFAHVVLHPFCSELFDILVA